jgi:SAM-dependent methyltransferase
MAHFEQQEFVRIVVNELNKLDNFTDLSVLDVGSYDVGGSVKKFFPKNQYLGVDLAKGPNVDVVLDGSQLEKLNKKFDIVISCECFEHAKNWDQVFQSMYNVCKDNGFIIFTCASRGRIEHGTARTINSDSPGTDDTYYKNIFKNEFEKNFEVNRLFNQSFLYYNIKSSDLYFFGSKNNQLKVDIQNIKRSTKLIKNKNRKIKIFRIILSYFLSDKKFQDFTFLRRRTKDLILNRK